MTTIDHRKIYDEIRGERIWQTDKWGEQNHDSVPDDRSALIRCQMVGLASELRAKLNCDDAVKDKRLTWAHIAVEELAEAVSARNEDTRREELVQLAAVVVAWIDCIDRANKLYGEL